MAILRGLDTTVELTRHAEALRSQGYDFAMRYYSNNASKNLSLGEARALSQAGLKIGVVWETSGTHAAFFTRAQGLADGAAAFQMARDGIGQPFGSAIYFAVDYDPTQADLGGAVSTCHGGACRAVRGGGGEAVVPRGRVRFGPVLRHPGRAGQAALSWLSQSTGCAGSRQYAEQQRYDILQLLPVRIPGADGIVLDIDPDATHPDRDGGLFTV